MNARDYALAELDRIPLPGWKSGLIRRKVDVPTDSRDLGLAEHIRVGVIKNMAILEHVFSHYARRADAVDPIVRKIVIIGLFQLRMMSRIPPSAAVDEAVEQARRFGRPHAAGFVNAILRRAAREPDVPIPNRPDDVIAYARIVLSHPEDLVRRLIESLGEEGAIQFCGHNNDEPPTLARLFKGIGIEQLAADGLRFSPHEQPGMVVVEGASRNTFAGWAARGVAQVQDATAAQVVDRLSIEPGNTILDRCAGLGTKTFQMRDSLGAQGSIVAMDPSEPRVRMLRKVVQKREFANIAVAEASMLTQLRELAPPCFDRILVDVPCSNSGVLARRPEARYSQSRTAIESLAKLQDQIMDDSAAYLRKGGILVYSTCSIWPEENEQRIARFLQQHEDYELVESLATLPSLNSTPTKYHDGGFFAVLRWR